MKNEEKLPFVVQGETFLISSDAPVVECFCGRFAFKIMESVSADLQAGTKEVETG